MTSTIKLAKVAAQTIRQRTEATLTIKQQTEATLTIKQQTDITVTITLTIKQAPSLYPRIINLTDTVTTTAVIMSSQVDMNTPRY